MSLLMKALEKAAKDRGEARNDSPTSAGGASAARPSALTLEPLVGETPAIGGADPAPAASSSRPPSASAGARAAPQEPPQARAATVVKAAQQRESGAVSYMRSHPLVILGGLAGLIGVGFGIYVYLQITNPALFRPKPAPAPPSPVSQAPRPADGATAPAPPAAIAAAPLIGAGPDPAVPAATPPVATAAPAAAAPPPAPAAVENEPVRNAIKVSSGSTEPALNPLATQAYAAFQSARYEDAERLYRELIRAEPNNVDGVLALASIAMQENRADDAGKLYLQALDLDPRNALAQSGLIGLLGRSDPLASEARLKQLIARQPYAFLHFTLGNLYADQSRWAQAQQAYFQAYHLEPGNAEYAYNLAVGLEHLSQPKIALGFYRRAVQLSQSQSRVGFSVPQAQARIIKLSAQVE